MKIRNKLIAALSMLIISALMLSTASYAWFTISTNPEIKNIQAQVVTNENLEIALAGDTITVPGMDAVGEEVADENIEWGNLVDLSPSGAISASTVLRPAKYDVDSGKFQYPVYGTDGRINSFGDLTEEGDHPSGNLTVGGKDYGYYIDVWLRTNVGGNLTFSTNTNRVNGDNTTAGEGSIFAPTLNADGSISDASKVFAENIRIATRLIAKVTAAGATTDYTAEGQTTQTLVQPTMTYVPATKKVTISSVNGTPILAMEANTAYLVRIYVWLDGAGVTNASASIDGTTISGKLNLQFAITGVDKPMN